MILSVAKKSRRWRGKLGSLVTIQVVLEEIDSLKTCQVETILRKILKYQHLHISAIRFNTSWNGVPGPLGAWREGALPGSVCHELNSFAAFTVLHPLNVTSKVKYSGLGGNCSEKRTWENTNKFIKLIMIPGSTLQSTLDRPCKADSCILLHG